MIGLWNDPEKVTGELKRTSNMVTFTISAITPSTWKYVVKASAERTCWIKPVHRLRDHDVGAVVRYVRSSFQCSSSSQYPTGSIGLTSLTPCSSQAETCIECPVKRYQVIFSEVKVILEPIFVEAITGSLHKSN